MDSVHSCKLFKYFTLAGIPSHVLTKHLTLENVLMRIIDLHDVVILDRPFRVVRLQ